MTPARRREVTEDGMTRVAAVVAAMVESSSTAEDARKNVDVTDLIAKAAQVVDKHAGAARMMRARGLAQQRRANASLSPPRAPVGDGTTTARRLDVTR
jgi:hypothetical protein